MGYDYYRTVKMDVTGEIWDLDIDWDSNVTDICEGVVDDLYDSDNVTGGYSGFYEDDEEEAHNNVLDNLELLKKVAEEMDCYNWVLELILNENWQMVDVLIRQYVLYDVVHDVILALKKALDNDFVVA